MSNEPDVQAPALNRRRVGDYVVTFLSDGFIDAGSFSVMKGISEGEVASMLEAAHRPPVPHLALASYAIQGKGRTILVDGGAGGFNGWGGRFRVALGAAGIEPDEVDTILLTHAHADHVGGLTLHGKPIFEKAEVFIHADEVKFWRDDSIMASAPDARPFFEAARTAFDAYGPNLNQVTGGEVAPGITLVPLPGHTPGHSGYRVASGQDQLMIWADIVHLPDVQISRPETTIAFDGNPEQARDTRMKILDEMATDRVPVAGMHFNMPGFIAVERNGARYAKVDLPWAPSLR